MNKQVVRILSGLLLVIMLVSCKGKSNNSVYVPDSDPTYKLKILEDVSNDSLVDVFVDLTLGHYKYIYPDLQYAHFMYDGDLNHMDEFDATMTLQFTATEQNGILSTPVLLSAVYDANTRVIYFYRDDYKDSGSAQANPDAPIISSERFNQFTAKMMSYFQHVNISGGYVEISENVADGNWIVYHFPEKNGRADVKFRIAGDTFDLIEYDMNP